MLKTVLLGAAVLLAGSAVTYYAGKVRGGQAEPSGMPQVVRPSQWTAAMDQEKNLLHVDGATYWVENARHPWSLSNPGGDDTTLRFELRPGDHWTSPGWTDPPTSERTEIGAWTHYPVGTNLHVSYDLMVEPGAANRARWLVIGQFHQASSRWSPPFDIELVGEKMAVKINQAGAAANAWSRYRTVWIDPQDIIRGRTYHIDFHIRLDPFNGHLDLSRDGVQLVKYDGPLGWSDMGAYVYWKQGVYREASDTTIAAVYSHLSVTAS